MTQPSLRHRTADEGFTLIEVVVALLVLGLVATGALWFFINGTRTSSHLERTQDAIAVANAAIERAYGIDPKDNIVTAVPGMAVGRAQADVTGAFAAMTALGVDGVADTYPVWDSTAATSTAAVLPITATVAHGGITYTVTTLVGACYRSSSVLNTDQDCLKLPGYGTEPSTAPSGTVRMVRTIVIVTWPETAGECGGTGCSYTLTGLVDRSDDLEWNQVIEPVAVDDTEVFEVGSGARDLNVLANDLTGPLNNYPVSLITNPAVGTASSPTSTGLVRYTPPAAGTRVSGTFPFTYRVRDARGASADAVVTIVIPPHVTNDTVTAPVGVATLLDITSNDVGSPASVAIVNAPTCGTATVVGTKVRYTATAPCVDGFTYTYTDGSGQVSPVGTVQVTALAVTATDVAVDVAARTSAAEVWTDLTAVLVGANPDPASVEVVLQSLPTGGTVRVDGVTYAGGTRTGAKVEFSPPLNSAGEYTFTFALSRGGYTSAVRTATVRVAPTAVNDAAASIKTNGTRSIPVSANDVPAGWASPVIVDVETTQPSSSRCGTFAANQPLTGSLTVTTTSYTRSGCSVTYRFQLSTGQWTNWATVTYSVVS